MSNKPSIVRVTLIFLGVKIKEIVTFPWIVCRWVKREWIHVLAMVAALASFVLIVGSIVFIAGYLSIGLWFYAFEETVIWVLAKGIQNDGTILSGIMIMGIAHAIAGLLLFLTSKDYIVPWLEDGWLKAEARAQEDKTQTDA